MKISKKKKNIPLLLTIVLDVLLAVAVVFLMRHVQNLLNIDAKINLTEIVTQNKNVITSKINLEVHSLQSVADQLIDRMKKAGGTDVDTIKKVFYEYFADNDDGKIYIAGMDGMAFFADGKTVNIAGRRYFRLSSQGTQNISDRIVSRQNGNEIFAISVPLEYQGEIIGTLQKSYSPEEMYGLCAVSLFSSAGDMDIINKEGYILISSRTDAYNRETENYFRMIYAQGNRDAAQTLQSDIEREMAGFMETTIDGEKTFSAYTPIEEIHDWYLISSVTTKAVSPNANIVIQMFYFILFVLVFVFALSLWGFLSYKHKQQTTLEHIAFVDGVTGGDTYSKFLVDLDKILTEQPDEMHYLLKFDIDNFKYVNNFYGFDVGDRILHQIYKNVGDKLWPGELLGRISGDYFVAMLKDADEKRLNSLFDSIIEEEGILVYFSAGLYAITDAKENVNLMVDKASTAAETAKGVLYNKVARYSEKFDQLMMRNEQMKRAVKQAIVDGEMIPFYQPKIDVFTGKIVGAEALARWRTKEGGLVPPNDFIPLCEKTGLIIDLDMSIFESVLKFLHNQLASGLVCVPISVNFSRMHLPEKDFCEKILERVHKYNVPPQLIELELTESAMFENYDIILDFINQLHGEGFSVSMDDFGSGYSSLNMLKDIPIDVLKVDRAFLQKSSDGKRQRIIFATIAQMAAKLDIKVVVEGVETNENVELMKEVGCSIAQGYYYARPMDEVSFEKMYERDETK